MRMHPAYRSGSTTLGFMPALVSLVIAGFVTIVFGWVTPTFIDLSGNRVVANQMVNHVLLGVAAAGYVAWILAVARGWTSTATGAGFVLTAHALILRIVVEWPQSLVQVPLAEATPPEPYLTVLLVGRTAGFVIFVLGLGFVVAAVIAERALRRGAPPWIVPPQGR